MLFHHREKAHVDQLPAPPPHLVLFRVYAYACSLPLKAPPHFRTETNSEPPIAGFSQAFPALETP